MNKLKTWAAAALVALPLAATAAPISGQGSWETTLKARDIDGNAVALESTDAAFFYDTVLDITWLRDWNANGPMNWSAAITWAAALDINGYTGWRLPTTSQFCTGFDCTTSEMGHMYYTTLGNVAEGPLANTAYFTNMQSNAYWSGTGDAFLTAWYVFIGNGFQNRDAQTRGFSAVAVRPGDVLAAQIVPEPGTLALLLAAVGVGAVVRRRAH